MKHADQKGSTAQGAVKETERKKEWIKPIFKDLRLGFEITMYFWNR